MKIPKTVLDDILNGEEWEDTIHIGTAPRSDNLGELYWGIFEHEGKFYRVKFIRAGTYWQSEMGQWEDPWPTHTYGDDDIECEEVVAVATTSYTYKLPEEVEPDIVVAEGASCSPSSGFWYSLFDGGYVDPDELLEKGADKVNEAVAVLSEFRDALNAADAIEEM